MSVLTNQNGVLVLNGSAIESDGMIVDIMQGATASTAGTAGLVPAPAAGDQDKVLTGGGTWVRIDSQIQSDWNQTNTAALDYIKNKPFLLDNVKTTMDPIAVVGTKYFLGVQTAVDIVIPTGAALGQEIMVVFSSGDTQCVLTCNLNGFNFVPQKNTTNKILFTLVHAADSEVVGDEDNWLVEIKEG